MLKRFEKLGKRRRDKAQASRTRRAQAQRALDAHRNRKILTEQGDVLDKINDAPTPADLVKQFIQYDAQGGSLCDTDDPHLIVGSLYYTQLLPEQLPRPRLNCPYQLPPKVTEMLVWHPAFKKVIELLHIMALRQLLEKLDQEEP